MIPPMFPPERIVCLTEETVETLYLLGEDRRVGRQVGGQRHPEQDQGHPEQGEPHPLAQGRQLGHPLPPLPDGVDRAHPPSLGSK